MGVVYEAVQVPLDRRVVLAKYCRQLHHSTRAIASAFGSKPKPRPYCTTSTLCRSLQSGATGESITTRCSSSTDDP